MEELSGGHVRFVGLDEIVANEEEEEASLPKARNAGVLRQTLALAVAGDGEPEPTGCLSPAGTFTVRCHRADGREGGRKGGDI
jgi:hypothetical protein